MIHVGLQKNVGFGLVFKNLLLQGMNLKGELNDLQLDLAKVTRPKVAEMVTSIFLDYHRVIYTLVFCFSKR